MLVALDAYTIGLKILHRNFLQVGNAITINFPNVLLGEFSFTVMEKEAASEIFCANNTLMKGLQ
jgi:hypothetical protein